MYVETGHLDADDDVAFRTHVEACNVLGHSYKGHQKGSAPHPVDPEVIIWFPKLNDNPDWENYFSDGEETLHEVSKRNNAEHLLAFLRHTVRERIYSNA